MHLHLLFGSLMLSLCVANVAAQEAVLYKCPASDGSIIYQQTACVGQSLGTLAVTPKAPTQSIELPNETCWAMAKDLWERRGQAQLMVNRSSSQAILANREALLTQQCDANLLPSQLAYECATLSAAIAVGADPKKPEQQAQFERLKNQQKSLCGKDQVMTDIRKNLQKAVVETDSE